jgi:hypothetical protein
MPLAGLVVNRVTQTHAPGLEQATAAAAAQRLDEREAHPVTAHLLKLHADRMAAVAHEEHLRRRFTAAHPGVPAAEVPALATDVHDLDGLRAVAAALVVAPPAESA